MSMYLLKILTIPPLALLGILAYPFVPNDAVVY